jgi:Fe-S oxidoreductase
MEDIQAGETIEQYLDEALISCEKCHLCNTVCPVLGTRVSQGPFGINRAIYYGLKWNRFDKTLRDLVYSCTTCGKCVSMCCNVSRALPLVEIVEKARELLLVDKMLGLPAS